MGIGMVVLALAIGNVWQYAVNRTDVSELQALAASQAATATAQASKTSITEQKRCAEIAAQAFARMGFDGVRHPLATFTNHYSRRFSRCYIDFQDTQVTGKSFAVDRQIVDALENKSYGSYMWINGTDKKYWEVKPAECYVLTSTGIKQICTSDKEFEQLAKTYMED
ncbi:MAG TPA: hypothetical protein VF453_00325 [Burkholderiaceae bacterium]